MRGVLGFATGALGLVALYVVVTARGASGTNSIGGLVGPQGWLVGAARRFIDPTIPAVPPRSP